MRVAHSQDRGGRSCRRAESASVRRRAWRRRCDARRWAVRLVLPGHDIAPQKPDSAPGPARSSAPGRWPLPPRKSGRPIKARRASLCAWWGVAWAPDS